MANDPSRPLRLGILNSHVIQYFTPLYREMAVGQVIEPIVLFCSREGAEAYLDPGFANTQIAWDVPLLEGYTHEWLANWSPLQSRRGFFRLINPSVIVKMRALQLDALLVHGHQHATTLIAIAAARMSRIPVLMRSDAQRHVQRGAPQTGLKPAAKAAFLPRLYRLIDAFLSVGSRNRDYYESYGVPPKRIFHAPFSIDNDRFAQPVDVPSFIAANGLEPDRVTILYAGKFRRIKRVIDLLRAFQVVQLQGLKAQLVLIGDGEERGSLEAYVRENHVSFVTFAGFVNQRSLPQWMHAADLFVLPSEVEPWGLVVNEAMAAGLPIIASTAAGATADLVQDGRTGFRFVPRDVAELSRRLEQLISDSAMRTAMSVNARQHIQNWSYRETIRGYEEAVRFVCRKASPETR